MVVEGLDSGLLAHDGLLLVLKVGLLVGVVEGLQSYLLVIPGLPLHADVTVTEVASFEVVFDLDGLEVDVLQTFLPRFIVNYLDACLQRRFPLLGHSEIIGLRVVATSRHREERVRTVVTTLGSIDVLAVGGELGRRVPCPLGRRLGLLISGSYQLFV